MPRKGTGEADPYNLIGSSAKPKVNNVEEQVEFDTSSRFSGTITINTTVRKRVSLDPKMEC